MSLEKFFPTSPDLNIREESDMSLAKFGHLNTIVEYINGNNSTGLKLSGNGLIAITLKSILDSNGNTTPLLLSSAFVTNYGAGGIISNTVFGTFSLGLNTTGGNNTAIGNSALYTNTTGAGNTAIGTFNLRLNQTGTGNTALGYLSLENNTNSNNTAVGYRSLNANTSGTTNVAVGVDSLSSNTTANNNTAIGYNTQTSNFSGSVILGSAAIATANNQFVVGSTTVNAGAIDTAAVTPTQRWKVKINGVDYYIALQPA
jgi:hypothetical protein